MIRLIQSEFIKNKIGVNIMLPLLLPIIAVLFSKKGAELMAEPLGISYESALILLSFSIFLSFLLPIITALYCLTDSLNESADSGWRLVLISACSLEKHIRVKYSVNIFMILCAYVMYGLTMSFVLYDQIVMDGGLQGIISFWSALLISFICILPWLVLLHTLFFMFPHVILKVFSAIFLILVNLVITQTGWWSFYPPSYYIMIIQPTDPSMTWIMCLVSATLFVIFFFYCSRLVKSFLRKNIV